jgi:DNA processing protein
VASRLAGLDPAGDLERAAGQSIRFVCPADEEWPERLTDLDHSPGLNQRGGAPLGLWVKGGGRLDRVVRRSVAVVGSRSATTYGAAVAGELAAHVAESGVTVVSGAAYGIDQAGHRGALSADGTTVAVLACGADRAYPAGHRDLLAYIADSGGLVVSEAPPGCAPTKLRFLSRNRLIAAMSLGTVVVEAAVRSGALNTANWAGVLNRVVMGVPGPVTSAPSEGVHELIRTRGAALVTRGSDVLELISPAGDSAQPPRRGTETPRDRLSETDRRVLDAVPVTVAVSRDSIVRTAGLTDETVREALLRLAEAGFVEGSPSGWRLAGAGLPVGDPRRP